MISRNCTRQLCHAVLIIFAFLPVYGISQADSPKLEDSTYQKYRFGIYAADDYFLIDTSANYRENDSTFHTIINRYDRQDALVASYPIVSEKAVQLNGSYILNLNSVDKNLLIHGGFKDGRLDYGVFFVYDEDMILLSALKFSDGNNSWRELQD